MTSKIELALEVQNFPEMRFENGTEYQSIV